MAATGDAPAIDGLPIGTVAWMRETLRESELKIALALAIRARPLSVEELAQITSYTERTVRKRVETLDEQLGGEPRLFRVEENRPQLHPKLAHAIRHVREENRKGLDSREDGQ